MNNKLKLRITNKTFHKKLAFTLAEVLITLGIIGIVAEMTIPTLMMNFQRDVTVTRLKESYSMIYQAIRMSEANNGPTNTWTWGVAGNRADTEKWFNTYMAPYIKYTETDHVDSTSEALYVKLVNGTEVAFHHGSYMDVVFYFNKTSVDERKLGKDCFAYIIDTNDIGNALRPYSIWSQTNPPTGRNRWIDGTYGCSPTGTKLYCSGLIMEDGWRIAKDYPYFN